MARRSVLFTPGDRPELLRKAPTTGADAVVFDLGAAVDPDRKPAARAAVHELLADPAFDPDCEVCVGVNPDGVTADEDLAAILDGLDDADAPDAYVLPRVTADDDVETFVRLAAERGPRRPVFALIETARGVLRAESIADADATDALLLGAEELAAELGATRTPEGFELLYARERIVLAAAAAAVDAVDTLHADPADAEGLVADAAFAARLGFDGKAAAHPDQVGPINGAFTPDARDVP